MFCGAHLFGIARTRMQFIQLTIGDAHTRFTVTGTDFADAALRGFQQYQRVLDFRRSMEGNMEAIEHRLVTGS